MSAIIKSSAHRNVSAIQPARSVALAFSPEPWVHPEIEALRAEVGRLTKALAARDAEVAGHAAALERIRLQSEAAGRQAGLKEADNGREALIKALTKAAEASLDELNMSLAALERLAPELAIAGLEKILGPSGDRAPLMIELIRKQLDDLRDQAIVEVQVSHHDFHGEGLDALTAALDRPGLKVEARPALNTGDCRIVLRLGVVEIGVDQQWGRLSELLAALAQPEAAV